MMMYTLSSKSQRIRNYDVPAFQAPCKTQSKIDIGIAINIVAATQGVRAEDILKPERSQAPIARARQLAMYMTHVALGYSLTKTGQLFKRDRTTVSHACGRIEDLRDDTAIDDALNAMETVLNFAIAAQLDNAERSAQ